MPQQALAGDSFQVRVVGLTEGQETNNILYFTAATPIDDVELRLILALWECFATHLIPVVSAAWTLKHIAWKKVNPQLGIETLTIPAGQLQGQGAAAALPSFCSALVSIRTSLGGRSGRGRMYLPGLPEAATVNSTLDPNHAFWAALVAFAACVAGKFIVGDPPAANSFQMNVYSRKLGGSRFPLGDVGFSPVTSLTPNQVIASTRSRKLGRGA